MLLFWSSKEIFRYWTLFTLSSVRLLHHGFFQVIWQLTQCLVSGCLSVFPCYSICCPFMLLLLGCFFSFSHISFTAWCTLWLPNNHAIVRKRVLQRWDGAVRIGKMRDCLGSAAAQSWKTSCGTTCCMLNVRLGCVLHVLLVQILQKNVKIAEESTSLPVITLILPPFLLQ